VSLRAVLCLLVAVVVLRVELCERDPSVELETLPGRAAALSRSATRDRASERSEELKVAVDLSLFGGLRRSSGSEGDEPCVRTERSGRVERSRDDTGVRGLLLRRRSLLT